MCTLSNLTGEKYNVDYDPQGQTDVQRSWLYQKDPSLRAANAGFSKKNQVAFFDNAKLGKTKMDEILRAAGVTDVYVCGIATDVCVGNK